MRLVIPAMNPEPSTMNVQPTSARTRRGFLPRQATSGFRASEKKQHLRPLCPGLLVARSGRARRVGLTRRNNSTGRSGATLYFRAERVVWQQDGHPHLRSAPAAGPRPTANQVPPGPGPAPLALPKGPVVLAWAAPAGPERHCRERRGPSAGGGPGNRGAIRAHFFARSVNTEGPRP